MKGVFITGTDTGVGKTLIATSLAKKLRKTGIDVGVMKPVETGEGTDFSQLKAAAGSTDPDSLICPYRLKQALAPRVAAEKENIRIDIRKILDSYKLLESKHELVLVEGAGGITVPLTRKTLTSDLITLLNIPCIIVARAGLGTINHTYLTVEHLRQKNIKILAIVLNGSRGEEAEKDNPRVIHEMTNTGHLYTTPHVSEPSSQSFELPELTELTELITRQVKEKEYL